MENNRIAYDEKWLIPIRIEELDLEKWRDWQDWIVPFGAVVRKIGQPAMHPLHLVTVETHQFNHKTRLVTSIDNYLSCQERSKKVFEKYHLEENNIELFRPVISFIKDNAIQPILFDAFFNASEKNLLNNWLVDYAKFYKAASHLLQICNKNILDIEHHQLQIQWNQAKSSWFLPKWLKQRNIKATLQGYAHAKLNGDAEIEEIFSFINENKSLQTKLSDRQYDSFQSIYKTYLVENHLDVIQIQKDLLAVDELDTLLKAAKVADTKAWMQHNFISENIAQDIDAPLEWVQKMDAAKTNLLGYLNSIGDVADLQEIKTNIHQLDDWINYNIYKSKASELGLSWFILQLEKGGIPTDDIASEFERILHFNHFIQRMNESEELSHFNAEVYESLITQYKALHKEFTEISKNQLIVKLSSNIPNLQQEAAQSSEVGILQRAIKSKGRGLSIRKLFDQIPSLIPRLKPCMLMSPISVAQYFDVNTDHFDIVIFDEASQLPTAESISALARAKQAVIVGDPKQMPPTSFFASSKTDEDNLEMEDLESILDDCLALSIPSNYLLRHYRSKHESLISFSNRNFYDSQLLTFPSPDDLNQKVSFDFVAGFYDKGKTRTNVNEANAIIDYITQHLRANNGKSIGVVTFSQTQQSLIEDLLQKAFRENPALDEISAGLTEPIFIKNLENVQGDERDIILFSIGYGPDEEGRVSMNFGPLNRDGGWRRLNVAVTRARYEMKIFSSLRGDQIDLNRTKSEGVRGLRDFLNFAEKGQLASIDKENAVTKLSVVDSIANELEKNGLQVKKYIGTSNYKIDVAVIHPAREKEYILGILLDGDNYCQMHTTHDRELLAPNVLRGLGWNIFRIWTLDWLKNKENIIANIQKEIDNILRRVESLPIMERTENHEPMPLRSLISVAPESVSPLMQPYVASDLEMLPFANAETIYYPENRIRIVDQVKELVSVESPISKNALQRKILKLWNTSRAGAKLSNYLTEIVMSISTIKKTISHQEFYWSEEMDPSNLLIYRDNQEEKRTMEDIAQEEIQVVILEIMKTNISLNKIDLIRLTSKRFGFLKLGAQMEIIVSLAVEQLIVRGLLKMTEDKISI